MTIEDDALESVRDSGLIDVLSWAAPVAFAATDQMFDEEAGHDQMVIGVLNFKHLRDLIDRATSNGRFAIGEGLAGLGSDVLERGITPDAFRSMPPLAAAAVARKDYKQSPGWAAGEIRVLLQSFPFGKVDQINWTQRSDAKRKVASQLYVGPSALFTDEDFDLVSIRGIPDDDDFEGVTLIAAHAFNPATKQYELYIGQSKNPEYSEDSCWHWRRLILSDGTPLGVSSRLVPPVFPGAAASTDVEEVAVRIKKPAAGQGTGAAGE